MDKEQVIYNALKYLDERVEYYTATDSCFRSFLKITEFDFREITNELSSKGWICRRDQPEHFDKWRILPDGQTKLQELVRIKEIEKNNIQSKKNAWERWIKDTLGALGILGTLTFGILNTMNTNDKSDLKEEIKQLQDTIRLYHANAQVSKNTSKP